MRLKRINTSAFPAEFDLPSILYPLKQRNASKILPVRLGEVARNEPVLPIWEAITFTHLVIVKEKSLKQGMAKTRDGQDSLPDREKSPKIPARQETSFQKGGTSTAFQDVRDQGLYQVNRVSLAVDGDIGYKQHQEDSKPLWNLDWQRKSRLSPRRARG